MHSKTKGNIGEAATILHLTALGYNVFKELGDLSRIDLIAEKEGKCWRIQCKAMTPKNGAIAIAFKKSGPNYSFHYKPEDFDFMAIYDLENQKMAFISSDLLKTHHAITLRVRSTHNNQKKKIRSFDDYSEMGAKGIEPLSEN